MRHIARAQGHIFEGVSNFKNTIAAAQNITAQAAVTAPIGSLRLVTGIGASYASGILGPLSFGGPIGGLLSGVLSGGFSLSSLTGLAASSLGLGSLGGLLSGGLSLSSIAGLAGANLNIGGLSGILSQATNLGNLVSNGLNVSSLTSLVGANLDLGSLQGIIGTVTDAKALGDLVSGGLNLSTFQNIIGANLDIGDLGNLADGILDSSTIDSLVGAGLQLTEVHDLISSGLNAQSLIQMIGAETGLTQLLGAGVDEVGSLLANGLDTSILGEMIGAGDELQKFLGSDVDDAVLASLLKSGLNADSLQSILDIDFNQFDADSISGEDLINTPEGVALIESMLGEMNLDDSGFVNINGSPIVTEANLPSSNISIQLMGDVTALGSFNLKPGGNTTLVLDTTVVSGGGGVSSFNTRTGAITLLNTDVTDALTYTPLSNTSSIFANNLIGTIDAARLSGIYNINISGQANTALTANNTAYFGGQLPAYYANSTHTHTFASLTSKPTTLSGYGITDALSAAGGTLTGNLTIAKTTPMLVFNDTAQTAPSPTGLFRQYSAAGNFYITRNTSTARDFATETSMVSFNGTSGVASFNTSPFVGSDVIWNAGNDGAGSGLDADLLDGQHAAYYRDATNINAGTLNDSRLPATMSAKTFSGRVTLSVGNYADNTELFHLQPADYGTGKSRIFISQNAGTWRIGTWDGTTPGLGTLNFTTTNNLQHNGATIWTAGNDGSGSGLDADTVDGVQASVLVRTNVDAQNIGAASLYLNGARGLAMGYSGSDYGGIGYNITYSGTSGVHVAPGTDTSTRVDLNSGGLSLYGAASGTAGRTISWTTLLQVPLSGNMLHRGNTVWTSANDGASSGLDADTVDGIHATGFTRKFGILTIGNDGVVAPSWFTDPADFGVCTNSGSTGYPTTSGGTLSFKSVAGASSSAYLRAIDIHKTVDEGGFYMRGYDASAVATAWRRIWHDGNDGVASGLDADLLDGQHGAYYRDAGNLNAGTIPDARIAGAYTGITSLSMTGALTVNGTLGTWSVDTQGAVMDFTRASANYIRASNAAGSLIFQTGGANNRLTIDNSGNSTFTGSVTATSFSGSGSSLTALNATQLTTGTIPGARMPAFTGDATTAAGAVAITLATVNSNVGSFGSATAAPTFTVNAKGLLTAAGSVTITPAWSSITSKPTTISGYGITDAVTRASFAVSPNSSVAAVDIRNITNPTTGIAYVAGGRFRFSSLNDDSTTPYADVIDLSTYSDASGGGFNSLYFSKNSQVILHKYAAAGGTSWTTKTVAYTDSAITGSAATLTTGRTLAITGDLTWTSPSFNGSANVTAAGTLATVNGNVGSFGSATAAPTFTVNAKGLITAAGSTTITPAWASITSKPTTISGYGITDAIKQATSATINGRAYDFNIAAISGSGAAIGSWDRQLSFTGGSTDTTGAVVGAYGTNQTATYAYIGLGAISTRYTSTDSLRIYPTYAAWGTDVIWHAGNDGAGSGLDADLLDGQHGSYYLSAGSYTAADVLSKLLTVDGSGSGLDADLFDGSNSTVFVMDRGSQISAATNWNTFTTPGMYGVAGSAFTGTGNPSGSVYPYGHLVVTGSAGQGMQQTYYPHTNDKIWLRTGWNDSAGWQPWQQIWTSTTDGAGSGLDADLWDGNQFASYLNQSVRTDASPTFANVTATNFYGNLIGTANATNYITSTRDTPDNALQYWQASALGTTEAPSTDWHNTIRMGHGDPLTYYSSTLAIRMTGAGVGDIYTQSIQNGVAQGWKKYWNDGNDGAGSGLDADLLDGYQSSMSATINTVAVRDSGGYLTANWYNSLAGGLYSTTSGVHFGIGGQTWGATLQGNSTNTRIQLLSNAGADRGSLYVDSSFYMGFLTASGSWKLQMSPQGASGTAFWGSTTAATINLLTSDSTGRGSLHADSSGNVGLLDGSGNWRLQTPASGQSSIRVDGTLRSIFHSGDNINFDNGRYGLTGVYDAAQTQAIWAMGSSYKLTVGGASNVYGDHYGLAWSYNPDYGGAGNNPQSKAGLSHQLLIQNAGVTLTAIGNGIWTNGYIESAATGGWTIGSYANKNRIDYDGTKFRLLNSSNQNAPLETAAITATGAITSAGQIVWTAGNDGSGSGLDADLLDGLQSTSFLRSDASNANFRTTSGDGNGLRFWDSDAYKIYMSSATNGSLGGRVPTETTSDYNIYYKMGGGTNRGHVFLSGTTPTAGIDASGNLRNTGFTRSKNGFTNYGTNQGSTQVSSIMFPGGAAYQTSTNVITGAIRIKLPSFGSNSMLRFRVEVYNYVTGTSHSFTISGYPYSTTWTNVSAEQYTDSGVPLRVRFGHDGTNNIVWIGEVGTVWAYPQVAVTNFTYGYSGNSDTWSSGWAITFATAFDTVSIERDPAYHWNSRNDGAGSGLDADLLDGYQTTTTATASGNFVPIISSGTFRARIINNGDSGSDGMYIGYGNSNSGATRIYGGGSTGNALTVQATSMTSPGEVYTPSGSYFRANGTGGFYCETYNGGWNMTDGTWLRSIADKGILTGGAIQGATVTATSDRRLKTEIEPLRNSGEIIDSTNAYSFIKDGTRQWGVIAQEVQETPAAILVHEGGTVHEEDGDAILTVDYNGFIAALLAEVKDLRARMAALEAR